jgi:putative salt-induced outer membrane protein
MLSRLPVITLCLLTSLNATAQDQAEAVKIWSGEGALGFTASSGNTDAENLNASFNISREELRWKHSLHLEAVNNETDGETSADRWSLRERSRYSLEGESYAYGQARYEDDKFSGYDYQASAVVGYGSRFFEDELQFLDLSIGLGYRSIKETDSGDTENGAIVSSDLLYEYKLGATTTFREAALIEAGADNTFIESETSLLAKINDSLSSKISYLVRHNSEVPAGTERTDKFFTIALVYGF